MPQYADIQAITLDLDDTLWPVLPTLIGAEKTLKAWLSDNTPATAELFARENVRTELRNQILSQYPDRAHDMSWLRAEMLRQAMQQAGDDPAHAEPAFDLFLAARQQVQFYDDVLHVLERWAKRYPLVAISNGNADIHRVGLGSLFQGAVSAHEIGCAKPDPRMFQAAFELTGATAQNTLHIGDDWHLDIQAARLMDMQTAWIKRPDLKHDKAPPESASEPFFEDLLALDGALHG